MTMIVMVAMTVMTIVVTTMKKLVVGVLHLDN